jgi:UbiD family decarboxylase
MLSFVASTPLEYAQSEYKYCAALEGAPMQLTKTTDGYLDVPATAEYVLEGELQPRVRVTEGPFGEFPGSYSGARKQVLIKVKRVTHRRDPIFENLYLGRPWTEIDTLMALNTSIPLYKQISATMPEVKAVNAIYQHGLTVIIATDSRLGGYAKSVAFRAFSTPHGISYVKNVIVVDGDVDPDPGNSGRHRHPQHAGHAPRPRLGPARHELQGDTRLHHPGAARAPDAGCGHGGARSGGRGVRRHTSGVAESAGEVTPWRPR